MTIAASIARDKNLEPSGVRIKSFNGTVSVKTATDVHCHEVELVIDFYHARMLRDALDSALETQE